MCVAGCASEGGDRLAGPPPATFSSSSRDTERAAFVFAARDRGRPQPPRQMAPASAALAYVAQQAAGPAVDGADVVAVRDLGDGGHVVQIAQRIDGIEIYRQRTSVLLDRSRRLVAMSGRLHAGAAPGSARATRFSLAEPAAVARAAADAVRSDVAASAIVPAGAARVAPSSDWARYRGDVGAGFALTQAAARAVLFPSGKRLIPAYAVELELAAAGSTSSRAYAYVVAADDGRVLERRDLTFEEAFSYKVWAGTDPLKTPADGPHGNLTPHPTGDPNDDVPVDATLSRVTVQTEGFNNNPDGDPDPWLPASATTAAGNNIRAYADHVEPDGFSTGDVWGKVSSAKTFSWTFSGAQSPIANEGQIQSAIAQLFYVTNWLHDWYYDSGFDEAAGNAQDNNFGRGGAGGDPLLAEAQDTKGTDGRNNANMSTPSDGMSPRMQMYVWDGVIEPVGDTELVITSPATVAGSYDVTGATFGIDTEVTATGSLILVNDGSGGAGVSSDGCEPILNTLSNKIAVIDRGTCAFVQKANNADLKGARGVIITNNDSAHPDALPPLGGDDPDLDIPVVGVSYADGQKIKAALGGTVSANMSRAGRIQGPDRDGTIDNSIVAHEWGHYLHHRLTYCGGPQCGAMSEGWGDFVAMHMHLGPDDDPHGTYAGAVWAVGDAYRGIRRVPYSVDFAKDGLTFKHIADSAQLPDGALEFGPNSESHNAGEVWASILFEAYVALIDSPDHGFYTARRRMSDYIVAGLMLAPPDPTFTEQRDAILAAVAARDKKDLAVIAEAFARRGAGTGAESPPHDSVDFEGVVESFELSGDLAVESVAIELKNECDADGNLDAAENAFLVVRVLNRGPIGLTKTKVELTTTPAGIQLPAGKSVEMAPLDAFEVATAKIPIQLAAATTGIKQLTFPVKVSNPESFHANVTASLIQRVNFDDVLESSATDDVESTKPAWTTVDLGEGISTLADQHIGWKRVQLNGANTVWHADDPSAIGEQRLESPVLKAGTGAFKVKFSHRYQFESGEDEDGVRVHYDGAVIEYSIDGGQSWADVSTVASPGYNGKILTAEDDTDPAERNPLEGRSAYVDKSTGYPALKTTTLDFGTAVANKQVMIRFRLGSDPAVGQAGWDIDNIQVTGISNTPFSTIVADTTACNGAKFDDLDGDSGGCRAGGPGGSALVGLLAVLGLALIRRRRP